MITSLIKKLFFDESSLCSDLSLNFTQYDVRRQTPYVSLWTGQIAGWEDRESNLFFISKIQVLNIMTVI